MTKAKAVKVEMANTIDSEVLAEMAIEKAYYEKVEADYVAKKEAERIEAERIEAEYASLGLTTIDSDTYTKCRSFYTANKSLEQKAEKVGELRSAVAMHLVDELGYDTPEHWISPNTRDSKSALSTAQYSDSLNMFSTFIGDTYKGLLPKTLSNGIKFALGTEDVDDYGKNHPRRKLIIDAGRQPASIQKDFAKIAMELVKEREVESMTDDEKAEAEANTDHQQVMECFNKLVKAIEKKKSQAFGRDVAKDIQSLGRKLNASASDVAEADRLAAEVEPNH